MKNFALVLFSLFMLTGLAAQNVSVRITAPVDVEPGEEFKVELSVNKGNVSGFARLQVDFPEEFIVNSSETAGATFSYQNGRARFLWMALPGDAVLNVSCRVMADIEGTYNFDGSFSYVLDNETQRSNIPIQTINVGTVGVVADVVKTDPTPDVKDADAKAREEAQRLEAERRAREEALARAEAERLAKAREEAARAEAARAERERAQPETREPTVRTVRSETPAPTRTERGVTGQAEFRVQVGASRRPADPGFFSRLERGLPEFEVVRNDGRDGWYRYTIGSFSSVGEAQQVMRRVQQLGMDSFVTAFNKDGERITVAEAKRLLGQ